MSPKGLGFPHAFVLTSVSLLSEWVLFCRRQWDIRFRCVAHYVKVVATSEGLLVCLFPDVGNLFVPFFAAHMIVVPHPIKKPEREAYKSTFKVKIWHAGVRSMSVSGH